MSAVCSGCWPRALEMRLHVLADHDFLLLFSWPWLRLRLRLSPSENFPQIRPEFEDCSDHQSELTLNRLTERLTVSKGRGKICISQRLSESATALIVIWPVLLPEMKLQFISAQETFWPSSQLNSTAAAPDNYSLFTVAVADLLCLLCSFPSAASALL